VTSCVGAAPSSVVSIVIVVVAPRVARSFAAHAATASPSVIIGVASTTTRAPSTRASNGGIASRNECVVECGFGFGDAPQIPTRRATARDDALRDAFRDAPRAARDGQAREAREEVSAETPRRRAPPPEDAED
jgi:hypothetical protein